MQLKTSLKIRHVSTLPDETRFTPPIWTRSLSDHEDRDSCLSRTADNINSCQLVLEVAHCHTVLMSQHGNSIILCLSVLCILE